MFSIHMRQHHDAQNMLYNRIGMVLKLSVSVVVLPCWPWWPWWPWSMVDVVAVVAMATVDLLDMVAMVTWTTSCTW